MTATIDVTFDDAAVLAAFDRLQRFGRDTTLLMEKIGSALVDSTKLRFQDNVGPDGARWKALNPAYDAFRRPGPILVQSAALRDSITFRAGAREVQVGSGMIYAGVQQFGAKIVPKQAKALVFRLGATGGFIKRQSVTIPARPYLGVSAADQVHIVGLAETYLSQLFDSP